MSNSTPTNGPVAPAMAAFSLTHRSMMPLSVMLAACRFVSIKPGKNGTMAAICHATRFCTC